MSQMNLFAGNLTHPNEKGGAIAPPRVRLRRLDALGDGDAILVGRDPLREGL